MRSEAGGKKRERGKTHLLFSILPASFLFHLSFSFLVQHHTFTIFPAIPLVPLPLSLSLFTHIHTIFLLSCQPFSHPLAPNLQAYPKHLLGTRLGSKHAEDACAASYIQYDFASEKRERERKRNKRNCWEDSECMVLD